MMRQMLSFPSLALHDQTELDSRRSASSRDLPRADHLFLALECDRPLGGGLRADLTGVIEVSFGRGERRGVTRERASSGERLAVQVPDRRMSSNHARLVRRSTGFELVDAGSTNGTFLDGQRVEQAEVRDGGLIELGRTFFVFRERLATPRGSELDIECASEEQPNGSLGRVATLHPDLGAALDVLETYAQSDGSILLLGETGSGKEILARALHVVSKRRGPFVAVNCGAIPRDLIASTLFGHKRGSFSGATDDAQGAFRSADHGTLLLDEIGDLPLDLQVVLLRVLDEREVVPVGSVRGVPIDLQVIAATHAPLAQLVTSGKFRPDLLYRLAGYTHSLPALRDRREDLGVLIAAILRQRPNPEAVQFSADVGRAFLRYDWPGNVRELRQVIARAKSISPASSVDVEHLPDELIARDGLARDGDGSPDRGTAKPSKSLSDEEHELVRSLEAELINHRGNVTRVANALGKERMQIQRWMKRFGLDAAQYRER
jgi:DNA-binding NtrC family response regulator